MSTRSRWIIESSDNFWTKYKWVAFQGSPRSEITEWRENGRLSFWLLFLSFSLRGRGRKLIIILTGQTSLKSLKANYPGRKETKNAFQHCIVRSNHTWPESLFSGGISSRLGSNPLGMSSAIPNVVGIFMDPGNESGGGLLTRFLFLFFDSKPRKISKE